MPTFDELVQAHQSQTAGQQFDQAFNSVGQYTSGFSAPVTGIAAAPINPGARPESTNPFSAFVQKLGQVATQTADLGKSAVKGLGKFVEHSAQDIYNSGLGTAKTLIDLPTYAIRSHQNEQDSQVLRQKLQDAQEAYSSGKMSGEDYHKTLKGLNQGLADVNKSTEQIASSRNAKTRAKDVVETAFNILTLGDFSLVGVGSKQALDAGSKEAIDALINEGSTNLEKLVMRVPSVRALVGRNAEYLATRESQIAEESVAQWFGRNSKKLATDLLIKRPVFYQSNVGQAVSAYEHILKGEYKGALTDSAWLGVQMLEGGPLGAAQKLAGWGKSLVGKLAIGKGSFIDELSSRIGDGNRTQIARFLNNAKEKAPGEFTDIEKAFRVFQESNLRNAGENVPNAVDNFMRTYTDAGIDTANLTPSQIYKDMRNWYEADTLWKDASKAGQLKTISEEAAAKYTPVRWDAATRDAVASAILKSGSDGEGTKGWLAAVAGITDNPGVGFGSNNNLMLKIQKVIGESQTAEEAARGIRAIDAASTIPPYIPKKLSAKLSELGYTMAIPEGGRKTPHLEFDDTRKLVSAATKGSDVFEPAVAPQPQLHALANIMQKAGVSPQEANTSAYRKLSESVVVNLDKTIAANELGLSSVGKVGDTTTGGQVILSKLQQFIENKPGVRGLNSISAGQSSLTDIRQMTIKEIGQALGTVEDKGNRIIPISDSVAKEVRQAVLQGYRDLPLEVRGLGDKVIDGLYQINPMQKYYSRIQSALRYTYNPFFRSQELAETKILSHATANNLIWGKSREELNTAAKVLTDAKIFSGALVGEGSNDQVLGRITANLTGGQKRDLAGLALDIAKSQGTTLDELAKNSPEVLDDALRVIVQYPKKGILSSPMARTLNLVFFPVRYNAKVTMVAAKALAKQPPSVQAGVLHSLFNMKDWLKSDEGIQWQSNHADALGLFNWITPINSIEATFKLLNGSANSFGDLGQLGGLPLGIITQILDGQGLINLNRPYVEPKTGDVFPKYIPKTAKARASTALADLLNTMFTYPGRTLGLPGKSQAIRGLVNNFIDTNGADFDKQLQTDRLTPLQQKWVQVLKGDTSKETIDSLYHSPAAGQFNWYTLPPNSLPFHPNYDNSSQYVAPKSRTKRKKITPVVKTPL